MREKMATHANHVASYTLVRSAFVCLLSACRLVFKYSMLLCLPVTIWYGVCRRNARMREQSLVTSQKVSVFLSYMRLVASHCGYTYAMIATMIALYVV